jgi:hypothetical protein
MDSGVLALSSFVSAATLSLQNIDQVYWNHLDHVLPQDCLQLAASGRLELNDRLPDSLLPRFNFSVLLCIGFIAHSNRVRN